MDQQRKPIPFSPPNITQEEIDAVVETLKSGWITTGHKVAQFENSIASYCNVQKVLCVNSATAGLELVLRAFDIQSGDEVITTPYTYAATANVICHVGATPVFVDVAPGSFNMDPGKIAAAITPRTKAIIPVDIAGYPCDYAAILQAIDQKKNLYQPTKNTWQHAIDRPIILSDAAHSFGAIYNGKKSGSLADISVFSFHAVKNLTTAEGGAITFNQIGDLSSESLYTQLKWMSLHGQNKDAMTKLKQGGFKYDILFPGFKCNMTDISAALGIVQLKRYDAEILPKRKAIFERYLSRLKDQERLLLPAFNASNAEGSYHLFPIRILGIQEPARDEIIYRAAEEGIALNVHFIPCPLLTAYKKLGYRMEDYPNAFEMYQNEISLPIYPDLSLEDVDYICQWLIDSLPSV